MNYMNGKKINLLINGMLWIIDFIRNGKALPQNLEHP